MSTTLERAGRWCLISTLRRLSIVGHVPSLIAVASLGAVFACRPVVELAPERAGRRVVVVVEEGRAAIVRGRQIEVEPGSLVVQWYLSPDDFLLADGRRLSAEALNRSVSIRLDDEARAPGFGECGRCAAPTRAPPYVVSPGDSCPLPATVTAEPRRIGADGASVLTDAELSAEEQAALQRLAGRIRLDWEGACTCPSGLPFEPAPSFELTPVAPASSRHGFWASAIRQDGLVVAVSTAYLHVFDVDGAEYRSSSPFETYSIDGIVPLPDGRFMIWGVDDTKPVSVSTRAFFIDPTEPAVPTVQPVNVVDWPLHASFRLKEWYLRPSGAVRLVGFAVEPFRGNVDEPMVVDCVAQSATVRCTRLEGRRCRDNDIALMTVDTPDEPLIITRRMIQAVDRCVDIDREIESVVHPSGRVLTGFRDLRKGAQNGRWVYFCARFDEAAIVYATSLSTLEQPSVWTALSIDATCREDEDFVQIDDSTYYVVDDRGYRLEEGTVAEEISLDDLYGPDAPRRVASYEHASVGEWTLAGLGFDQLVLQRRQRGAPWRQLRAPGDVSPPDEVPYAVVDEQLIGLSASEVDASMLPGPFRILSERTTQHVVSLLSAGERVYAGRQDGESRLQVDVLDRALVPIRSFSLPSGIRLVRMAPMSEDVTILGTSAGLWFETMGVATRVEVPQEHPDGWHWEARGGAGGVWALGEQKLYLVQPGISAGSSDVVASQYGPGGVRGYDISCSAQLVFLRGNVDSWITASGVHNDESLDRVLSMRPDPTLVTEASFNPDLRGRPIDMVRRGRRAIIATDWNLLVSAGAEVVARAPFRIRRIHVDARGHIYVEGYQGRLAVSDRPVLAP